MRNKRTGIAVAIMLVLAMGLGGMACNSSGGGGKNKIVIPPLSITTSSLTNGQVGVPYSAFVQTTGGSGLLSFSISSGSLPTGLSIHINSGEIYGAPQQQGTVNFDVAVMDSQTPTPDSTSRTYSLTIDPGVSASSLLVNEIYTGAPEFPIGSTIDFVEILNPLAVGEDLTGWTLATYVGGVLEDWFGLPSFTLPSNGTLAVRENTGVDQLSAPPYVAYTNLPSAMNPDTQIEVILYDDTGVASDYVAVNWGAGAPHLPANLGWTGSIVQRYDPQGGNHLGDAIRASMSDTDSGADFIVVHGDGTPGELNPGQAMGVLSMPNTTLRDGYEGFQYFAQLQVLGGVTPYSFSGTNLPPGLTLNSDGTLTGTTSIGGGFTMDVTVFDAGSPAASGLFQVSLTVIGGVPAGNPADIKVSEVGTNTDYVEILNTGAGVVDIGGWYLRLLEDNSAPGVELWMTHVTIPRGVLLPPGQTLVFTEMAQGWLSTWELGAGDFNILWNAPEPGAVAISDPGFTLGDYMNWDAPTYPKIPPGTSWTGSVISGIANAVFERSVTSADTDTDADWCEYATGTPGAANACP